MNSPYRTLWRLPWASLGRQELPAELKGKCAEQRERVGLLTRSPRFSLVVTVPEGISARHWEECLACIAEQSYPNWELIAVMRGTVLPTLLPATAKVIKAAGATEAEAKRLGAAAASGDWIGFIRGHDFVNPACLFQLAWELQQQPDADLLYTNEVTVDSESRRLSRFLCKSEFSRFNLLHFNAIGSLWVVRRAQYEKIGGHDPRADGFEDQDVFLRLAEVSSGFRHVPYYFYHRRETSPVVSGPAAKDELANRVRASLSRLKSDATVAWIETSGVSRLKVVPAVPKTVGLISAILCFRNRADWTLQAARALVAQRGQVPLELILVDNDSSPEELAKVADNVSTFPIPTRITPHRGPFNFGHMHNTVIREQAKGDLLLFLNNDVFLEGAAQLDEWAAWAAQPWAGTVGILLRHGHGNIQHSGISVRFGGEARLVRVGHNPTEGGFVYENREVFANTFAACLVKRSVFDAVGGLRAVDMANGFGDVAFNLDCLRRGWHNLFLGHLQGTHLESASRGVSYEYWEERELEREYPELLEKMLRCDYGYDRVPMADYSIPYFLGEALKVKFRERTPWLNPVKPTLKKLLWKVQQRVHNRA